MAITQSQYTPDDKVAGDIFYSADHNEMKSVLNQKTDADNAILIEGNQTIDGSLSIGALSATSGEVSGQFLLTKQHDHIRMQSTRTDGNVSLERDTLIMTKADAELDFYVYSVTDAEGKFYINTSGGLWTKDKISSGGRLTISHRENNDDAKAIVLNPGAAATTTPTDIIWSREGKEGARQRFNTNFDMYFSVMNNSNVLKSRIGIGSQRGTGLKRGVTLYDGDTAIQSMYTLPNGIHIPTAALDTTGIQILSKTTTGYTGSSTTHGSGSIFFKETKDLKYGIAIEYFGDTHAGITGNRLYINRFENSVTPIPIVHFSRTNNNITHYGSLTTATVKSDDTAGTYTWMRVEKAPTSTTAGKLILTIDGPAILHGGDKAGEVSANSTGEVAIVSSDFDIKFYSNLQTGWSARKEMSFNSAGKLTVEGEVYATNFQFTSDIRLKENVTPLVTELDIDFIEFNFKGSSIKRYGVSAQAVQAKLPELVTEDGNGDLTVAMVDLLVIKVAELERKLKELTK